jgi:signal recognition particle GTPase
VQAVVVCGVQGSGKTTFYWERFGATLVVPSTAEEFDAVERVTVDSGRGFAVAPLAGAAAPA